METIYRQWLVEFTRRRVELPHMERRMEFCMHIQTSLTPQTRSSMFIFRCAPFTFNKTGGNLLHIHSKLFSKRVFHINTIVMILVYYYHDAFHVVKEGNAKACPLNLIFLNLRPLESRGNPSSYLGWLKLSTFNC